MKHFNKDYKKNENWEVMQPWEASWFDLNTQGPTFTHIMLEYSCPKHNEACIQQMDRLLMGGGVKLYIIKLSLAVMSHYAKLYLSGCESYNVKC